MTHPITSTESNDVIAAPPLVLVSDGIKSIYVNWQGPPVSDGVSCSSSGPVIRSVLTGRNESVSAIARAEIGNPDYAVKFSPMAKGQARLEVARATPIRAGPAAALPTPRRSRKSHRQPTVTAARSERGTAADAAAILGFKPRKLQAMSQRGKIPGAAKLGRLWTYDLAKLRSFVEQQEQAICQNEKTRPAVTGAGKFSGVKLRSVGSGSGGRLRQMIRQSQRRAAKLAKRER